VASQVKEAVFESTSIQIISSNGYLFTTQGSVVVFDGYLVVMGREAGEAVLPKMTVGDTVSLSKTEVVSHESAPPPRYTEASLVKALEEKDIGRPSTYAPIISTIVERQYVKKEDKKLFPTELGGLVTDFLVMYFPDVMSLPFTARLEGKLDEVANGTSEWPPVIEGFFSPFSIDLAKAYENAGKVKLSVEQLDEPCPDCKSPLVLRTGRYGKFVACSSFPKCRYTRQYGETVANVVCPKCGGAIVSKRSKKGKTFYGCSNYPTCTFAAWKKEEIK
jgi:DNA topoisomerase-1